MSFVLSILFIAVTSSASHASSVELATPPRYTIRQDAGYVYSDTPIYVDTPTYNVTYANFTCHTTCQVTRHADTRLLRNVTCSHLDCHFRWCHNGMAWNWAANVIGKMVSPVIVFLGILGNSMSMVVMLRPRHRNTSFGVYLFALAIADNGCLVSWIARVAVMYYSNHGLSDLQCKLDIGAKYAFRTAGYAIILLLTADRFVVVCRPLRASTWCTSRVACRASISAFLVALASSSPNLVLQLRDVNRTYSCTMHATPHFSIAYAVLVLAVLVACSAAILTMNCVIVVAIKRRVKYRGVCHAHKGVHRSTRLRYDSDCTSSFENSSSVAELNEKLAKKAADHPCVSAISSDNSDMVS